MYLVLETYLWMYNIEKNAILDPLKRKLKYELRDTIDLYFLYSYKMTIAKESDIIYNKCWNKM